MSMFIFISLQRDLKEALNKLTLVLCDIIGTGQEHCVCLVVILRVLNVFQQNSII